MSIFRNTLEANSEKNSIVHFAERERNMNLRVRNRLPEKDPYAGSKTELQWRKENRTLLVDAKGEEMWTNQFCQHSATYYALDETRPATPMEIEAWKDERRSKVREKRRKLREAELEKAAIEKARSEALLKSLRLHVGFNPADIICLDTETTGLTSDDEILQISIINGSGEVLFHELIRPMYKDAWPDAEAINAISPEMVTGKPTIEAFIPRLSTILASAKLIIGYNIKFDQGFLQRAGIAWPKGVPIYDVMLKFAEITEYYGKYKYQKLSVCAEFFGYESEGRFHDSLEDVRATLFCYHAMNKMEL